LVGIKLGDLAQGLQNIVSKFNEKSLICNFKTASLFLFSKKSSSNIEF